jgi:hypothetical protein
VCDRAKKGILNECKDSLSTGNYYWHGQAGMIGTFLHEITAKPQVFSRQNPSVFASQPPVGNFKNLLPGFGTLIL